MAKILVIHHSPTPATRALSDFVLDAARAAADMVNELLPADQRAQQGIEIQEVNALEPDVEQLRDAAGVIFGTTANFGYISGALKHYFDSTFYAVGEDLRGIPMSWWIRGGYDTTGAAKAMRSITTGYGFSPCAEPVEFTGEIEPHHGELEEMAQAVVGRVAS
ncbi:flavodoxin family protein [uncultured Corynebacterium sp.]|uniref:flavodoxin family protein n=1 Tax=uncultured Corynebacterium sp. TaxID=159447 RepID=UPI0025961D97|nr:NAD(P)H-dependent oxidoreductase [uncultured Corynebacterium sp.]